MLVVLGDEVGMSGGGGSKRAAGDINTDGGGC